MCLLVLQEVFNSVGGPVEQQETWQFAHLAPSMHMSDKQKQ